MARRNIRTEFKDQKFGAIYIAAQLGYLDAAAGVGYRDEYQTLPQSMQLGYESGRLWASNMIAAGITPPPWTKVGTTTPEIEQADAAACEKIGSAIPPLRSLPPTKDPVLLEPYTLPRRRRRR